MRYIYSLFVLFLGFNACFVAFLYVTLPELKAVNSHQSQAPSMEI